MPNYIISERDHAELQHVLRWWRQNKHRFPPPQRRRAVSAGGGSTIKWFRVTSIASDPLTGIKQTCDDGVFSDVGTASTDIYIHPELGPVHYKVGDKVAAVKVGNCYVSLYHQPCPFDVQPGS